MKSLLKSSQVVHDFLTEKKGYFLDPVKHRNMTNYFLEGVLKGENWAPHKTYSEGWES